MDLVQQISQFTDGRVTELEESDRVALLQASNKLAEALENPFEKLIRWCFSLYDPITLRIAVDLNLVDVALAHGKPISLSELAEKSKADPDLVQRIMRMLVPLGMFTESSPKEYNATPLAPILATGSPLKEALIHLVHLYRSVAAMPDYFAANGYSDPKDAYDAPFNFAHSYKGSYFDMMAKPENERLARAFNATMELQKAKDDAVFAINYPVLERLRNDDPERVLLVDVGGSMGHQVMKFHEQFPSLPGKLAVEDLAPVIEKADKLPPSIMKISHDFLTPQPDVVRNAKAFYLRMILHDWPEKQARTILSHIVDVMAEDSVVLIHEIILLDAGVSHFEAQMDWHMMNMGALERTEEQWKALADSVGLEVKGTWWENKGVGRQAMIELGKKA